MENTDVAVVGAGAAGLACARELRRRGCRVAVFEARDRIGGRILTHRDERVPLPVELGAEFIHGEAAETHRLLAEMGLAACDIAGDRRQAGRGRLRPADGFWRQIDRVLQRIDPEAPDESFAAFLARRPGGRSLARARAAARVFVQGFHAADVNEIGVLSIAPAEGEAPSDSAARLGRIVQGYDQVPRWLARGLEDVLHLRTQVAEIAWERGHAELTLRRESGETSSIVARAAIVTVPLGVLQASVDGPGGLRLRPDPPRIRKAVSQLAMGSVVRLAVWFRDVPWPDQHRDRLSFLFTRGGGPFNVWWTAYPMRSPLAIAWSGGPPAAALAGKSTEEIASIACGALAEHLGISRRRVESRVLAAWRHDWDGDPFARGAYSYARVGGSRAAAALARPVEGTLFFAGEAADVAGRTGTVEGALATGLRAARQVSRSIS